MKWILSFLLFVFVNASLTSQVWIDQGAEWHFDFSKVSSGGVIKLSYTQDTIIQGNICQKLVPTRYNLTSDQFGNIVLSSVQVESARYTSVSGDTVFYLLNNQFEVLYNFGAQMNDTWDLGVDTNSMLCGSSFAIVDSIDNVTINSSNLRTIYMNSQSNSSVILHGRANERFGNMQQYLFPVPTNCDTNIIVDFEDIIFKCYKDNSFATYNVTNESCGHLISVENYEKLQLTTNVFPNPTTSELFIDAEVEFSEIAIYNLNGKLIRSMNVHRDLINVSDLPKGVYVLRLNSNMGAVTKRFVKL